MENCCKTKTKERNVNEIKVLTDRLSRIEGQIRGVKNMVNENAYCTDILIQVSAIKSALDSFSKVLLSNHIKTCVIEDVKNGKTETVDDLVETIKKLMR